MTHDGTMRTRARVDVPAKVNLFLDVDHLRDDGYHQVVTILQTVAVFDRVTITLDKPVPDGLTPSRVAVEFVHDGTDGVPAGQENLVVRAAHRLCAEVGIEVVPPAADVLSVHLQLGKAIPVAAGMAGGSADAAGTLIGLNALLSAGLGRHRLRDVAAHLGADVPFCVTGGTALATGTGSATADVMSRGSFNWVIGMSTAPLATPDVYAAWDGLVSPFHPDPAPVLQAVRTGDATLLGHSMHNGLQAAAFHLRPELADAVDAFLVAGALGAIVSGSGPTVVALAADADHARALRDATADRFDRIELSTSPASGPRLRIG